MCVLETRLKTLLKKLRCSNLSPRLVLKFGCIGFWYSIAEVYWTLVMSGTERNATLCMCSLIEFLIFIATLLYKAPSIKLLQKSPGVDRVLLLQVRKPKLQKVKWLVSGPTASSFPSTKNSEHRSLSPATVSSVDTTLLSMCLLPSVIMCFTVTLTGMFFCLHFQMKTPKSQKFSYLPEATASDWNLSPGLSDSNQEACHCPLQGWPEDTVKSKSSLRVIRERLSYDNMAFVLACFDKSYSF